MADDIDAPAIKAEQRICSRTRQLLVRILASRLLLHGITLDKAVEDHLQLHLLPTPTSCLPALPSVKERPLIATSRQSSKPAGKNLLAWSTLLSPIAGTTLSTPLGVLTSIPTKVLLQPVLNFSHCPRNLLTAKSIQPRAET